MTDQDATAGVCGGIHHVAICSRDFDRTVAFYTRCLGLRPKAAWGQPGKRAIMLDTGDSSCLEVFERPEQKSAAPDAVIVHLAFRTANCDGAVAKVRSAGLAVTMEPTDLAIPSTPPLPLRIAFCTGPDGEQIEFVQQPTGCGPRT